MTEGGLHIPDVAQDRDRVRTGRVVRLGIRQAQGGAGLPWELSEGAMVFYRREKAKALDRHKQWVMLHVDDVLAVAHP